MEEKTERKALPVVNHSIGSCARYLQSVMAGVELD
jgi:hypothetical protein